MSEASPTANIRPRRPWLAYVLGVLAPGLGHLYAGAPWLALAALVVTLLAIMPIAVNLPGMLGYPIGSAIGKIVLSLAIIFVPVPLHAALTASKRSALPLTRWNRTWIYLTYAVTVLLVCAQAASWQSRYVGFRSARIPSGAMMDTLLVGDYIYWDPSERNLFPVQRGDIVIFWVPSGEKVQYIKRVIGLPGETVELRNGLLHVNGEPVPEPYVRDEYRRRDPRRNFGPIVVDENHYFVLGDRRDQSLDSRYWGHVPREMLSGRARSIFWSYDDHSRQLRWDRIGTSLVTRPLEATSE